MKKNSLLIIVFICLFIINVKADMGPPSISTHKVMVTNKEGTYCYDNGKKTDKLIPYGTMLDVMIDIEGSFIYVHNNEYDCYVKYVDVSARTQSFDLNSTDVEKITPVKAVVLASGGLNLRVGPSVTYSKIITIPQYTVVTLKYQSGSYWFYTEYKGKTGWITSMNSYFGTESDKILYNYEEVKIYNYNGKTVLGKIPAQTEITDYLVLNNRDSNKYYVNYNGIKGYITNLMFYKLEEPGRIKLIKDYEIVDETGKPIKKLTANQELEYNMMDEYSLYIPEKNTTISRSPDYYEEIKPAKLAIKKRGFIGEGLFGEEKGEYKNEEIIEPTPENNNELIPKKEEKQSNSETIIIICLLAGIFLALTALVIVKIINTKKSRNVINYKPVNDKNNEETEKEVSKNINEIDNKEE